MTRATVAAAVVAAAVLSGCASWIRDPVVRLRGDAAVSLRGMAPVERPIPCGGGPFPSEDFGDPRENVTIGSLTFRGLGRRNAPSRFTPGAPALTVPVEVPPRSRAIIAIPNRLRPVAGLDGWPRPASTPATAHRAALCETSDQTTVFRISFTVDGPRCVPVNVTIDRVTTTRWIPFGVPRC
jgi:hypothetical protein